MKLTKEWQPFNHAEGYEKEMQDVKLTDGQILQMCWPNAGWWYVGTGRLKGAEIKIDQTTAEVRKTHSKLW